ncbi:MAG: tryptophan--tRNA ligase [Planctomycetota bacterium]|nr:tryptophan--tRNA ligase [Planctomycetota bacterium]
MKKRLLSGMRPTGALHLGNYVGALKNWVKLQEEYECYYTVVDWHALMSEYKNPSAVREAIPEVVADWLACGIDPKKSVVFKQSDVKEHLELAMIFGNLVSLGRLYRCPTYKEQLRELRGKDITNYSFLGYPVLQAADILIYRAAVVPVGEDQLPHIELTREIARDFNSTYKEVFPEPDAILTPVPRLPGLDGRKMSKSYGNAIFLGDTEEEIKSKVMVALTDTKRARKSDPGHPDECNLFPYYLAFFTERSAELQRECVSAKIGCVDCKKKLAGLLSEFLSPIREKRQQVLKEPAYIDEILGEGAVKARKTASETMRLVRKAMGLI